MEDLTTEFTLLYKDQFGPDGPQAGDVGELYDIVEVVSDFDIGDHQWLRCTFPGHDGYFLLAEYMIRWNDDDE